VAALSKYQPQFCDELIEHMKENTFGSFGAKIGVSIRTMQRWSKQHEDWAEAIEIGRCHLEQYLWDIGKRNLERAKDDEVVFNATVWAMMVKNCINWRSEPKDEDKDPAAIEEVQITAKTPEERAKRLRIARGQD
jgi:hypothetical protein